MKIFISYGYADKEIAQQLTKSLKTIGATVFTPQDIGTAENWQAAVRRNLETSDQVVVLLSEKSTESPYVLFEAGLAAGLKIPVTMIGLGVKPELQSKLGALHYIRYSNIDSYIEKLSRQIEAEKHSRKQRHPSPREVRPRG